MSSCQCPACSGVGHSPDFICCGRSCGECCGSPDLVEMPCSVCSATGSLTLDGFLEYAIQTRDRSLLAEYEAMLMIENLGEQGLPFQRKAPRGL